MIESWIRPFFERNVIDVLIRPLQQCSWVSPNYISFIAGVLGLCVPVMLYWQYKAMALIFILISGFLDVLDGALARAAQSASDWGAFVDIFIDRLVESCIIVGIFILYPQHALLCLLMLASVLLCVTSFLLVGVFVQHDTHKSFYYSPGLIERAEAFMFFIAMIFLPSQFVWLACSFIALVLLTTFCRMRQFYVHVLLD